MQARELGTVRRVRCSLSGGAWTASREREGWREEVRQCGLSHGDHCFAKCGLWDNWAVIEVRIPEFPIRPAQSESLVDVAQASAFCGNVPRSPRCTSGFEKRGCRPRLSTPSGYGANALGSANSMVPTAVFPFTTL